MDGTRVILWGTSFGGGHVLTTAADDGDIAAVISQCPFTSGLASSLTVPPAAAIRLTARVIADVVRGALGAQPLLVPSVGPPGSVALMSSPDAESGYLQLVPDGNAGGFDNRIAARVALQIIRYYPGRRTAEINCPVFFAICDTDSVAPAGPSLKYAEKAPHANVKLYHAGYFDIYIGEPFERAVRDQLEFLERVVPVEQRIP